MCGNFGLIRSARDPDPTVASTIFAMLGCLAEHRGHDAAGFALVTTSSQGTKPSSIAPLHPISHRDVQIGHCRVVKDTRPWQALWHRRYLPALHQATIVLGHTRHASQGAPDDLTGAAPMVVGAGLIGTHNGEIDADDLWRRLPPGLAPPHGDSDTERLLLALDRVRGDLGAVCDVLSTMRGLAALAWVDRARPHLAFLARGALSPLALAWDTYGNLYWGSSPAWFRRLNAQSIDRRGLQVELLAEGTVLVIATGDIPTVIAEHTFTPTARPGDAENFPTLWLGLDPGDVAAFRAEARRPSLPKLPHRTQELLQAGHSHGGFTLRQAEGFAQFARWPEDILQTLAGKHHRFGPSLNGDLDVRHRPTGKAH